MNGIAMVVVDRNFAILVDPKFDLIMPTISKSGCCIQSTNLQEWTERLP